MAAKPSPSRPSPRPNPLNVVTAAKRCPAPAAQFLESGVCNQPRHRTLSRRFHWRKSAALSISTCHRPGRVPFTISSLGFLCAIRLCMITAACCACLFCSAGTAPVVDHLLLSLHGLPLASDHGLSTGDVRVSSVTQFFQLSSHLTYVSSEERILGSPPLP